MEEITKTIVIIVLILFGFCLCILPQYFLYLEGIDRRDTIAEIFKHKAVSKDTPAIKNEKEALVQEPSGGSPVASRSK